VIRSGMGVNPTVIIDSLLPGYAGNRAVIWLILLASFVHRFTDFYFI